MVLLEVLVLKAHKAYKVVKVHKAMWVHRALKEVKDHKVSRVQSDLKDLPALKD
jgi:hypothetical protein